MTQKTYIERTAHRVSRIAGHLFGPQDPELVEHLIGLALFTIAQDVRDGLTAEISFLGELEARDGMVVFRASEYLLTHNPQKEAV